VTGKMHGWCLEHNDSASLRAVLPELLWEHRDARRIHLIGHRAPVTWPTRHVHSSEGVDQEQAASEGECPSIWCLLGRW
jgi:hypothetical protein